MHSELGQARRSTWRPQRHHQGLQPGVPRSRHGPEEKGRVRILVVRLAKTGEKGGNEASRE